MMQPNDDFLSAPKLDYDGFRAAMREDWGWFTPARETIIFHNDQVLNVAAGDVVLLDSTRPVTFISPAQDSAQWLGLQVPRQKLASHLGFEPQGGACGRRQAQAARLLCQLALDPVGDAEPASASADRFMPLVVYDL